MLIRSSHWIKIGNYRKYVWCEPGGLLIYLIVISLVIDYLLPSGAPWAFSRKWRTLWTPKTSRSLASRMSSGRRSNPAPNLESPATWTLLQSQWPRDPAETCGWPARHCLVPLLPSKSCQLCKSQLNFRLETFF